MAADAHAMPSRQAEYENLVLNRRVETSSPFIARPVWNACGDPVIASFKGLPVYGGLDLSETTDLTALVLLAPVDGQWHVKPTFWLPAEGLLDKARHDRVPYDMWAKDGCLDTTPGRSIEYEYIAERLRSVFDELDVRSVAFDRWGMKHLKPWLAKAGFTEAELERFVDFGQGFQSMSPALRDLESALLSKRIAHGDHPVLTMCAQNAVVVRDPAGNKKLAKNKSRGRIDGMVSLAMAMSVAATYEAPVPFDAEAWIA
jgi:phage terminase large subunit-like protein